MNDKLNIGWISAASFATTGYGKMTKEIVSRLIQKGYTIYNIGGTGGNPIWGGKLEHYVHWKKDLQHYSTPIPVLPTIGEMAGRDSVSLYNEKYHLNCLISLWDSFAIEYMQHFTDQYTIAYIPIDSEFTRNMYNYVKDNKQIVAMSKYGYNELLKWFEPEQIDYIPHGIDTQIWKPNSLERNAEVRKQYGIAEDCFLIMANAANVGERKQLPLMLQIFKYFHDQIPNSKLFMFTNPNISYPRGYNLVSIAAELGLEDAVIFPYFDPIIDSWDDKDLIDVYSMSDIFFTTTLAEGFGIPMLEAMACGTPVVGPLHSTIPELVENHGYFYKVIEGYAFYPVWIPTGQKYPVPNAEDALEALLYAYEDLKTNITISYDCVDFAKQYDWEKIMPKWENILKRAEFYKKVFNFV